MPLIDHFPNALMRRDWPGFRRDWRWDLALKKLPKPKPRPWQKRLRKGGRPRISDRNCMEAIVWMMLTDGTWERIPERFAHPRTVRRRLTEWRRSGRLQRVWRGYLKLLSAQDRLQFGRLVRLTGTRKRADWRLELDLEAAFEARRRWGSRAGNQPRPRRKPWDPPYRRPRRELDE